MSSSTWGSVGDDLIERGCGGRETALIMLSREWARLGHEVTCFVPRQEGQDVAYGEGTVSYRRAGDAAPTLRSVPFDVIVSWEEPQVFLSPEIAETQGGAVRLLEMQVAHLHPRSDELEEEACTYVALSPWHEQFLLRQGVKQPIVVLPNGIDFSRYASVLSSNNREAQFIYSSSPDRGLGGLLHSWPLIRDAIGVAEDPLLHICYGVENWLEYATRSHHRDGDDAVYVAKSLGLLPNSRLMDGVVYHGRIGQNQLAQIQRDCVMMTYPADTVQPTETGCVSVIESCAAGAVPVITDCDCLGSEFQEVAEVVPLPFDPVEYAERVVALWKDKKRRLELAKAAREFARSRSWDKIARQWVDLFETAKS